ncbi:MAG TPA: hypothetical protein VGN32_11240 [Ktedonobacterales bacterium]|jgi:hypothetical protein|nr:hypothetical protein [Ktedonobacterales bacterium]
MPTFRWSRGTNIPRCIGLLATLMLACSTFAGSQPRSVELSTLPADIKSAQRGTIHQ